MRGNAKAAGAKVRKSNFNSRLYMRGNRCSFYFLEQKTKFQFTPLHERQRLSEYSSVIGFYFNSRLYMRGNRRRELMSWRLVISIHASTWEATIRKNWKVYINTIFQFTPLHERQHHDACAPCEVRDFNSRLYMRGSLLGVGGCRKGKDFNSRLYMRGSLYSRCHNRKEENFNSRLYMRGSVQHGWTIMVEQISIHASTWEAAASGTANSGTPTDFNSRLYMRGSAIEDGKTQRIFHFNSRLYMRGSG